MRNARLIQTIDTHSEGNPTRVVVGGVAVPPGRTLEERRHWLRAHDDQLRRILNFEPRGSGMMCSVLLMPPLRGDAHFAVLFLEQDEYPPMCGSCIMGAAVAVVETGMFRMKHPASTIVFETPAGPVSCVVRSNRGQVDSIAVHNVPGFVLHRDAQIVTRSLGTVRVDVAYGGDFYAIVDADTLGLRLAPDNEAQVAAAAAEVIEAVGSQLMSRRQIDGSVDRCYETLFTTGAGAHPVLRQAIVVPPGRYDRSPCGTGTSARLAVMYAKGEIAVGERVVFEGILGTTFEGQIAVAEHVEGRDLVRPVFKGRSFVTGINTVVLDRRDPFPEGFRIGDGVG